MSDDQPSKRAVAIDLIIEELTHDWTLLVAHEYGDRDRLVSDQAIHEEGCRSALEKLWSVVEAARFLEPWAMEYYGVQGEIQVIDDESSQIQIIVAAVKKALP